MTKKNHDIIEISCRVLKETDKAYRIDHGGKEPCWVPKSECEWDASDNTMQIPEWLCLEKGII